jgi:hypothetical protein
LGHDHLGTTEFRFAPLPKYAFEARLQRTIAGSIGLNRATSKNSGDPSEIWKAAARPKGNLSSQVKKLRISAATPC